MRDARPLVRFLWKVALMRNANNLIHQSERCGDLGRSG
jgi:hypothetical protein